MQSVHTLALLHAACTHTTITACSVYTLYCMCLSTQMNVIGSSKSLHLMFSEHCPHVVLRGQLESFLVATHSLPLLLKGICATESTMVTLTALCKRMGSGATLTGLSPPNVQLKYSHLYPLFCTVMYVRADCRIIVE